MPLNGTGPQWLRPWEGFATLKPGLVHSIFCRQPLLHISRHFPRAFTSVMAIQPFVTENPLNMAEKKTPRRSGVL